MHLTTETQPKVQAFLTIRSETRARQALNLRETPIKWQVDAVFSKPYFESQWKPKSWPRRCRFVMIRTLAKKQQKGPVQLDLFVPYEYGYEFKVIVTNKELSASALVSYHGGRGWQEGVFGELKTQCQMDYIPVRKRCGNETFLLAGLFAFNLIRDLQMQIEPPTRTTSPKRPALWVFEQVDTLRRTVLQRAGRLSRPSGTLTLTFCAGKNLKQRVLHIMHTLDIAP